MLFIDEIPILTTIETVIMDLKHDFNSNGISLFNKVNNKNSNYLLVTCPFHENNNRPDLIISKHTTKKYKAGFFYCFGCKTRGTLEELISRVYGKNDGGEFGKSYLLDRYSNYEIENRSGMLKKIRTTTINEQEKKAPIIISEECLDKYRYTHPYLYSRGLTDEDIYKYDLGYEKNKYFGECIVFPIRDKAGNCISIGRRTIHSKHYYYEKNFSKGDYLYGYYEMKKQFPDTQEIYVCESVFNLYTLNRLGFPTVALLGTGSASQARILSRLPYRHIYIALDSDKAGDIGSQKLMKYLGRYKLVNRVKTNDSTKDFNDYSYCNTKGELLEKCTIF